MAIIKLRSTCRAYAVLVIITIGSCYGLNCVLSFPKDMLKSYLPVPLNVTYLEIGSS